MFHQMDTDTIRSGKFLNDPICWEANPVLVSFPNNCWEGKICKSASLTIVRQGNFENQRPQQTLRRKILKISVPNNR